MHSCAEKISGIISVRAEMHELTEMHESHVRCVRLGMSVVVMALCPSMKLVYAEPG